MKILKNIIAVLTGIVLVTSCQKEYSLDTGKNPGAIATGTLKDTLGNCQNMSVAGTYIVDSTLKDSNYVLIKVTVSATGSYNITSDVQNGFSFKDSGYFSSTGLQTIKLKGSGKPVSATTSTFSITFDSSACTFNITTVASAGTGGTGTTTTGDYFPITTNSNWTYTLDVTADTLRFTVMPADVSISGVTYRPFKVSSSSGSDSLFYRKAAGTYYEFGDIDFLGVLDSIGGYIDYPFLKDNVAVNNTWESGEINAVYSGKSGKAKDKFTIIAKDIQKTINGILVDSVIQVQRDLYFQQTGTTTYSVINTMNTYYAKKKGLLLIDGTLPASISPVPVPYTFTAKRYQVY